MEHSLKTNNKTSHNTGQNSALDKHVRDIGHSINFRNVKILTHDQKSSRLMIKESIEIRSKQPKLNVTDTSVPLYGFSERWANVKISKNINMENKTT